jgi:hypothetical protein
MDPECAANRWQTASYVGVVSASNNPTLNRKRPRSSGGQKSLLTLSLKVGEAVCTTSANWRPDSLMLNDPATAVPNK